MENTDAGVNIQQSLRKITSIHQVVDPVAGVNIQQSLRKIISIHQVVDPDAGINILKALRKQVANPNAGINARQSQHLAESRHVVFSRQKNPSPQVIDLPHPTLPSSI